MIRILHVVGGMNRGGLETWLMQILRHNDRSRFEMNFLTHTTEPCAYDDEVRRLGSRIFPCLHPHHPLAYARAFRRILGESGPYDVVHSHVGHFSGFVLRLAADQGVPLRIAHCHNDLSFTEAHAHFARGQYFSAMHCWIDDYATCGLAASERAARALFGSDYKTDQRWHTLSYAIDLAPFEGAVDHAAVRRDLEIPPDAFVIGHVGRFVHQKNHPFLLDVFAEVSRRDPSAVLVLIGEGPRRQDIEARAAALGLTAAVRFVGVRDDVPRVMKGAIDAFVLPSHFEGLGLVVVEAQAAAVPCVISDVVPEEADVVPALVRRLPISAGFRSWADAVVASRDVSARLSPVLALSRVTESPFNITHGVHDLEAVYHA